MKRREFMALLGGAAAWPTVARAQRAAVPVVGFLRNTTAASSDKLVSAFTQGLRKSGYVAGENVTIEYRWADNHDERLPALAADLAKREVAVLVAGGGTAVALAAKAATQTIPVVFELGGDPVKLGLVSSLNRPGGNLTGIALFANVVGPKRLQILHRLAPAVSEIGLLVNPTNANANIEIEQAKETVRTLGINLHVLNAQTAEEIDTALAALSRLNARALVVTANPLFVGKRDHLVAMANRYAIPTVYPFRDFAAAGGLASYGDSLSEAFRQVGSYTGRILNGEKPADLPVVQPTKFELVINLKTAKQLGLEIPGTLLAVADEVIE